MTPEVHVPTISAANLLGGLVQSFFLGTVLNQAVKYWTDYGDDSRRKRMFVATVVLLSLLQTILEDFKVWRFAVYHKRWATANIQWSDLFLNGLITSLCEGFFVRRCWKMTRKSRWVLFPLSVLLLTIMVANLYLAIAMGITFRSSSLKLNAANDTMQSSRYLLPTTVVAFSCWIFGSLLLDTLVASISVISLWRSKTGLIKLDQILLHIIQTTLESAALPLVSMLTAVVIYHADRHHKRQLVVFFVLLAGKLYTIGLLRTLNSRMKLRERMNSRELGRTSLGDWHWEQVAKRDTMSARAFITEPPKTLDASATLRSSFDAASQSTNDRIRRPEGVAPHDVGNSLTSVESLIGELKDP